MILKIGLLLLAVSMAKAEVIFCNGRYWSYKFQIDGSSCKQEQKVLKDIPGAYKKGHINSFEKSSATECWKSLAKIQMDSAKCCTNDPYADFDIQCKVKNIFY